jgi:hypothetical protein
VRDTRTRTMPRGKVYNDLRAFKVEPDDLTADVRRIADELFALLKSMPGYKNRKEGAKRKHWRSLVLALCRAAHTGGCVRYPRRLNDTSKVALQVIDCAQEARLIEEFRSPPGSPKQSRALPLYEFTRRLDDDPWSFDPDTRTCFVRLCRRDTGEDLPVNVAMAERGHVAAETQQALEVINRVNSEFAITYRAWDKWEERRGFTQRLRPVHVARFTENWDLHGRLYTGRYGHQSLRKIDRGSIEFGGEPSVEPDFQGMHARLLYHLRKIDYRDDPYNLWGNPTLKPQRFLAKIVVNAAINARGDDDNERRDSTIKACNLKANPSYQAKNGIWRRKQGKAKADAQKVREALDVTGLKFAAVYDRTLEVHHQIAEDFACDMGIRLMRWDSAIALFAMFYLAKRKIPCLCCHDSFIVPKGHVRSLLLAMKHSYRLHMGFDPVIRS